ncbi:hypothetical protein H632_c1686p0, partial [Helicosporidium sp. ATCC 50920]
MARLGPTAASGTEPKAKRAGIKGMFARLERMNGAFLASTSRTNAQHEVWDWVPDGVRCEGWAVVETTLAGMDVAPVSMKTHGAHYAVSPPRQARPASPRTPPPPLGAPGADEDELRRRADRAARFQDAWRGEDADDASLVSLARAARNRQRDEAERARTSIAIAPPTPSPPSPPPASPEDFSTWPRVLGTNQSLEKSYLRLTTLPRSSEVRPPEVLALALTHVRRQVCADAVSLAWAADQLKAVRQDLLVQREVSSLTWDSYVASGRVAVQVQDWAELRQCLAALRDLDAEGLGGEEAAEFQGYALLLAAAGGTGSFMLELQTQ